MPPRKGPTREQQPFTGGLGKAFTSPIRRSNPKRPNPHVEPLGNALKRQRLLDQISAFQAATRRGPSSSNEAPAQDATPTGEMSAISSQVEANTDDNPQLEESSDNTMDDAATADADTPFSTFPEADASPSSRRMAPNRASRSLYFRWNSVIPTLIHPFLTYSSTTTGQVPAIPQSLHSQCNNQCPSLKSATLICLFHTPDFANISVTFCECQSLPQVLLLHGLFPTAPTNPRMAVFVHLLDFYQALFERTCDAVNALSHALNAYYQRRGFVLRNRKGQPIRDSFHRGLGYALQWYDKLQVSIEEQLEAAIVAADQSTQATLDTKPQLECDRMLRRRCPACFGGKQFGQPFQE
ncbi:hypothetical protein H0H92_005592 [Tricholoma furcatifolium]|nr:hypothetical protein H0H92_005592 [Tricholoma furcatifolium]